jgi:hypothetical protein
VDGYLQFNLLVIGEQLEEIVVLKFNQVVVYKGCHTNLIFRQSLASGVLHIRVVLAQNVVHIDFLNQKLDIKNKTYPLCEVLDQNADCLYVLSLALFLHHGLHLLLHPWKVGLHGEDTDEQQVLGLDVLSIVRLQLCCLLLALRQRFVDVSEKERSLDHVEDVKVFFHVCVNPK